MRLMRLPGEPARGPERGQSFVKLGAVLADTDALDMASSMGDGWRLSLSGSESGLASGVLMGGVESVEMERAFVEGRTALLLPLLLLLYRDEVSLGVPSHDDWR